eukprot:CAMPEP_0178923664 /NCGR_PEP_ID=MMETSP0786-20121207/16869_1 /TAXON_ID=186022 /ORGANISM="Thalassionema frauenfeldii, Strain CCMP 1798" /LENGTH=222 /DNA_ID=CAMNT_0020598233 /DNA_START=62 /DNA_END=733 /DNA_ORIENTATION=+
MPEIRKRGTTTALASAAKGDETKGKSPSEDNKPDKVTFVLVVILVVLLFYNFVVPRASKIRHRKAIEHQFKVLTDALQEQQDSLKRQHDSLSGALSSLTTAQETVSQSQHEDEIKKFESRHDNHDEEIAILKADLKKKDTHSELLEKQITELRAQLQAIEKKMGFDHSTFCEECVVNFGSLTATCGKRRQFVVDTYKKTEEVVTEALMKSFPDCAKKARLRS